jgi:hypothetical protein
MGRKSQKHLCIRGCTGERVKADQPNLDEYSFRGVQVSSSRGGHTWALGLSACLILVVCIRFFSEDLRALPALVQYIDVPLTGAVAFCALLGFLRRGHRVGRSRLGTVLFLFLLVSLGSALINMSRTELLPTGMFIFNFLCPLVFAVVIIDAPLERKDMELVLRTFLWLGVLQLAVSVVYSLPKFFATSNPDFVSGTFGRNAYQFTYFIGLWFLYVLGGTLVESRHKRRWQNPAIALAALFVFGLFYAAQYRAMLIFFTLVILFTLWASPMRLSKRLFQTIVVAGVSVAMLVTVATAFPSLKLLKVFDLLEDTSPVVQSGKVQAMRNVGTMYGDMPHTMLVGAGPATFVSRSFKVFASTPKPGEAVGGLAVGLMGGLYSTDVATKYVSTIEDKPIQGGTTASSPYSSFTALAAEVGSVGLFVYLSAYLIALVYARRRLKASVRAGDRMGARLAFTCFGGLLLLLVQAVFDNWLETTRVSIPLWTLVGLLYALGESDMSAPQLTTLEGSSPRPAA